MIYLIIEHGLAIDEVNVILRGIVGTVLNTRIIFTLKYQRSKHLRLSPSAQLRANKTRYMPC